MPTWLVNFFEELKQGDPSAIAALIASISLIGAALKWLFSRKRTKPITHLSLEQVKELVQQTPTDKDRIIKLLTEAVGIREEVIRTLFDKLGHSEVPPEHYPDVLVKVIEEIQQLQIDVGILRGDSPEIQELFDRAKAAVEKQQFGQAEEAFKEVENKSLSAVSGAMLNAAQAKAGRARIRKIGLDYRDAAQLYLDAAALVKNVDQDLYLKYLADAADTYYDLGNEFGDNASLDRSISLWKELLEHLPRNKAPNDWATTQNNLGNALARLGERESGTARLEEAVAAYREALEEFTEEETAYYWEVAKGNLEGTLKLIEERKNRPHSHRIILPNQPHDLFIISQSRSIFNFYANPTARPVDTSKLNAKNSQTKCDVTPSMR